jgi:uncharacterized protein (TIGR00369 family)
MSNPGFEARCRASFAKQEFMRTLGAELARIEPGEVVIELPFSARLTQQHGFLHAGAVTSIVDSACGYAALSLMPENAAVLSVEFKINLMKPAAGTRFRATGKVLKAGRTLSVCSGSVEAQDGTQWSLIALMQATMMCVRDRDNVKN